jgi:ribosome maturation factor RimP
MADVDLEKIASVIERVVVSEGLEYIHSELRGMGNNALLRVTIDRPEGVTHQDCAFVSTQLDTIFDVEELIPFAYTLEVSSPGLGRALQSVADFERHRGEVIRVRVSEEVDGRTRFKGRLEKVAANAVYLAEPAGTEVALPVSKIMAANVVQLPKGARSANATTENADEH